MTRAIVALLQIMSDTEDAPLRRRLEATELLLAYEAPQEAVDQAKAFLTSVFEDAEQRVDDRLDALKLMRRAEARKTAPTVTAENARKNRELWRQLEIGHRREKLFKAGLWEHAPKDWAADLLSDDYIEPPGSADDALRGMARKANPSKNP